MSRSAFTALLLSCVLLALSMPARADDLPYRFGLGKADITGEAAEVGMMGYSSLEQKTAGIHMRQWARAFVIEEAASGRRLVYVNTDLGMIFQAVHLKVLARLKAKYPGVYDENNVMLAATHTHSGPGGFSHYAMYNLSVLGFQEKTFNAIVDGIVRSIERAQARLQPGRLFYGSGELRNASRNRSLLSHLKNPDIAGYEDGIDPQMSVLSFVDANGELAGAISWFPVHSTSMTNANHLISPDNKGYASYHWEHDVSRKSGFVAAFAQTNAGNLSPNLNLKPGSGPFDNEFDNTREIGLRQFAKAYEIAGQAQEEVLGELDSRFRFVDFTRLPIRPEFTDGQPRQLCTAAIGTSLAAGSTEDGPGPLGLEEGNNPFLSALGGLLTGVPPQELVQCQAEKTILADTGNKKPYPWTPTVLPIQMFRIGQLELLGAPRRVHRDGRGADPPRGAGGQRSGRYPPCGLQWLRECLCQLRHHPRGIRRPGIRRRLDPLRPLDPGRLPAVVRRHGGGAARTPAGGNLGDSAGPVLLPDELPDRSSGRRSLYRQVLRRRVATTQGKLSHRRQGDRRFRDRTSEE